jgi:dihydrofolate synthase/folylpolyglutamate synthase
MSYRDTIDYLYSLQKHGIKLGLDNIRKLLACIGNPEASFRSIHIAGTNGKGSTSAMIASILNAAGFKVGLFTSPHLVSFTERIRINDEQITESEVVSLTEEIRSKMQDTRYTIQDNKTSNIMNHASCIMHHELNPTFFEFVTAMGFLYFKRKNVDWAVVETGMGGRLDATNVLIPEVSVITNIGYDHKEFLGNTISAIAGEKAGIIKEGIPVVCAMQEKDAENVIRAKAEERSSPLFIYGKDFNGVIRSSDINGITFDYYDSTFNTQHSTFKNLFIPLAGGHQFFNACLAIKTTMIAMDKVSSKQYAVCSNRKMNNKKSAYCLLPTAYCQIKEGLATTRWPGRLEFISDDPPILIDGAHNPSAAKTLSDSLRKDFLTKYKRLILIIGIMSDKDIEGIIAPLLPLASEIIFTAPNYERAAPPQKLAELALHMGFSSKVANSVRDAIDMAKDRAEERKSGRAEEQKNGRTEERKSRSTEERKLKTSELPSFRASELPSFRASELILITGSFYTIGEAKEVLGEKSVLGSLRETL